MRNDRYLSPTARRRREIVADIELILSYATGILTAVVAGIFLLELGVL